MLEEQLAILRGLWQEPDGVVVQRPPLHGAGVVVPAAARPAAGAEDHRRRRGEPALHAHRGALCGRVQRHQLLAQRVAERFAKLDETARAAGRDPSTLIHSAMVGVLVGRDQAEVDRRCGAILEAFGVDDAVMEWFEERRPRWVFGTPDEARAMVAQFAASGAERLVLQDMLPWDLEDDRPSRRGAGPRLTGRRNGRRATAAAPAAGFRARLLSERGGLAVGELIAADWIGVRAAGTGQALRDQLKRRGRPHQGGDGTREGRRLRGPGSGRPAGGMPASRRPAPRPGSRPPACRLGRRPPSPAGRVPSAPPDPRRRQGPARRRSGRPLPAGGRGGTSPARASSSGGQWPPRS